MTSRQLTRLVALFLALGLFLIACGGGGDEPAAEDEDTSSSTEDTVVEDTTEEVMADEGCMDTITLGAAVSETGKYAREGKDTRQGYLTWLDWVNNEYGGIKVGDDCYNVEIVYYDDEGDPDTAANLVERLITEDEVDFLLGPYSSGLTMSTSAIAENYGMIMVEGNGASESIFERGFQKHLRRADTGR